VSAEEALNALARDLIEEIATGRALELAAGSKVQPAGSSSAAPSQPPLRPAPAPLTGAGAVHPMLGHHLIARMPGDTISAHAHRHVPRPVQPMMQDPQAQKLAETKEELGQYKDWAGNVSDYQRASKELEDHAQSLHKQGIALPGTYKPWTPDEHASHSAYTEDSVTRALSSGKSTAQTHSLDGKGQVWEPHRAAQHRDIVNEAMEEGTSVPAHAEGAVVGGLRTKARDQAVKKSLGGNYIHADPEAVKAKMAERGMVPEVAGLSPMEASPLVHEEATHVSSLIASAAMARKKNLAVHLPMSSPEATTAHISHLHSHGYSAHGLFVHTPVDKAVNEAQSAHRRGHEQWRQEKGVGAKHLPPSRLGAAETTEGSSVNKDSFEFAKPQFDSWEHWDASDGPVKKTGESDTPPVSSGITSVEELHRRLRTRTL
jgi:Zeta toxin